jgi:hypothetical protein
MIFHLKNLCAMREVPSRVNGMSNYQTRRGETGPVGGGRKGLTSPQVGVDLALLHPGLVTMDWVRNVEGERFRPHPHQPAAR